MSRSASGSMRWWRKHSGKTIISRVATSARKPRLSEPKRAFFSRGWRRPERPISGIPAIISLGLLCGLLRHKRREVCAPATAQQFVGGDSRFPRPSELFNDMRRVKARAWWRFRREITGDVHLPVD